jgi:L-threonylcarbamoyladenylate synthase
MPILDGSDPAAVARAAERLAAGGLVALPTETVYGLGARADDAAAVGAIFAAKGRPADHPLIVHVAGVQQAQHFAAAWPDAAARIAQHCWPGPVSLVVPRRAGVAEACAAGAPTIALRCPAHPVARALLAAASAFGIPGIAAPSANRFGHVSPTRAAHVADEFGPEFWVLDGGDCPEGIESAIVDCSRAPARLLRPGTLTREAISAALGAPLLDADAAAPRVSGSLASHYAPRARLRLWPAAALNAALGAGAAATPGPAPAAVGIYSRCRPPAAEHHREMPDNPAAVAHELYAVLREFDALGLEQIWVEAPPATQAWAGVRDRLQRAAAADSSAAPAPPSTITCSP